MISGYEGYSAGNSGIADRRRVLFWASKRGHSIVSSRDPSADVIVVTSSSDLGYWAKAKISKPLVLDVVDGLIGEQSWTKDLFRGYGYWSTRRSSNFLPKPYSKLILEVAQRCKTVVCSSPEQVLEWAKHQIEAIDILDIHDEIQEINHLVSDKKPSTKQIFWEGLPTTLGSMSLLNEFFSCNQGNHYVLNVLTELNGFKYMNKYGQIDLVKMLSKQLDQKNLSINNVQWSPKDLVTYAKASTLGVIPIMGFKGYNHLKAENRLLIMWRLGLPVLTSPLPSYVRVMSEAGIDGICYTKSDWTSKIQQLIESEELRLTHLRLSEQYLREKHNTSDILLKWDRLLL